MFEESRVVKNYYHFNVLIALLSSTTPLVRMNLDANFGLLWVLWGRSEGALGSSGNALGPLWNTLKYSGVHPGTPGDAFGTLLGPLDLPRAHFDEPLGPKMVFENHWIFTIFKSGPKNDPSERLRRLDGFGGPRAEAEQRATEAAARHTFGGTEPLIHCYGECLLSSVSVTPRVIGHAAHPSLGLFASCTGPAHSILLEYFTQHGRCFG